MTTTVPRPTPARSPLASLRDRALRLWLARAMPELATPDVADPMFEQPLAVIDVIMRGHGLSHYASDF